MKHLPAALALVSTLWPALLGVALADRIGPRPGWTSALVYAAASHVCHQRPDRSFRTDGQPWPVCGRCAGLYLAAPVGAWFAAVRRRAPVSRALGLLLAAALPTAATLALEMASPDSVTSLVRAVAALPLGAGLAYVVVATAGAAESIG